MLNKKILAIDYGLKRTGLAITDSNNIIASPLEAVRTNDLFLKLSILIKKEDIGCLVVGLPKSLKNLNTDATKKILVFIEKVKNTYTDLQIEMIDERFTSKMADKTIRLLTNKQKVKRNKELNDMISATLILQSYLNKKK